MKQLYPEILHLTEELKELFSKSPNVEIPLTQESLYEMVFGDPSINEVDVTYLVNGELKKKLMLFVVKMVSLSIIQKIICAVVTQIV